VRARRSSFLSRGCQQGGTGSVCPRTSLRGLGGIDVLHWQRGNGRPQQGLRTGCRRLGSLHRGHLRGVFLCAKYAIPYMLDKGGSIVHTSSVTGIVGCAESSGVQRFQRRDRGADPEHGARLCPISHSRKLRVSRVHTNASSGCPAEGSGQAARLEMQTSAGRLGTPEDHCIRRAVPCIRTKAFFVGIYQGKKQGGAFWRGFWGGRGRIFRWGVGRGLIF